MRWVGIDEAGYGPNLGPMVMTAVVAEGPDATPPDLWRDLATTVARAGCPSGRLWVDDSKAILRGRSGRDRLEVASLADAGRPGWGPPLLVRRHARGPRRRDIRGRRALPLARRRRPGDPPPLDARAARTCHAPPPLRRGLLADRRRAVGRRRAGAVQRRAGGDRLEGQGPFRRLRPPPPPPLGRPPPMASPRSSGPTSTAAATSTSTRSWRSSPTPGSTAAKRARRSANTRSAAPAVASN